MQVYDKLSEVNTNHEELTLGWVTKKISLTGFYGYTDNRYNVHQPQEALVRAKDGEYLFGTDRHGKNKANYNATELNFDWLLSKQHEVGIQWEGLWLNGGRSEKQQQYYRYPNPAGEDTNSEMKLSDADGEMKYLMRRASNGDTSAATTSISSIWLMVETSLITDLSGLCKEQGF